jgi:outer membrane receptor protein involved in Fe transport
VWLDGYFRVDTSLTWQATEALSVGLAIDNLFDKEYQEAVGFPAAGIRGRVGARYRFR